jgi:7-carboxy-7-deazaguanine synthase
MSGTLVVNEIYLSLQGESTFAGLPCIFVRLTGCDLRCSYCDTAYAFGGGKKRSLAEIRAEVRRLARPFRAQGACGSFRESGGAPALSARSQVAPARPHEQADKNVGAPPSNSRMRPRAIRSQGLPLVELTGGEPLLQENSLPLMRTLCDDGFTVLLETNGARDISPVDPRVRRIVDLKCPGSGEAARNRWENLPHLTRTDEIKFVITSREDYEWAKACIRKHKLAAVCPLLLSWAQPLGPEQQNKSLKQAPPEQTPITRQALAEQIIADRLPVRFQVQLHKVIWAPEARGV